jgi:hypothetical protein
MHYTEPRYTKDIDIWIDRSLKNAEKAFRALAEYGAPLRDYAPEDFTERYAVFQIGVEPVRIDVLMTLAGVGFDSAWSKRETATIAGVRIHFLSRADLIRAKKAAGRRKDLDDVDSLEGKN